MSANQDRVGVEMKLIDLWYVLNDALVLCANTDIDDVDTKRKIVSSLAETATIVGGLLGRDNVSSASISNLFDKLVVHKS
jgi:hypothetical protein